MKNENGGHMCPTGLTRCGPHIIPTDILTKDVRKQLLVRAILFFEKGIQEVNANIKSIMFMCDRA